MNKLHLLHDAEKLYCVENLSPKMIAEKLNISRRTIFNWKKKYKWDNHIVKIKDFSKQFAGDIYNIGAKLLAKLNDDIDNNQQTPQSELYSLMNILKNLPQVKLNTDSPKIKLEKQNQIPIDIVKIVERDILGME